MIRAPRDPVDRQLHKMTQHILKNKKTTNSTIQVLQMFSWSLPLFLHSQTYPGSLSVIRPHSERTYQHYKSRPFTRTGTILCHFLINQELRVIGVRGLRLSGRALAIFSETETSAQASCGGRHASVRCADINLHFDIFTFSCKLNKRANWQVHQLHISPWSN